MKYLKDVRVSAVALVQRGANRRRLIYKSEKKERMSMGDFLKNNPWFNGSLEKKVRAESVLKALSDNERELVVLALEQLDKIQTKLKDILGYPEPKVNEMRDEADLAKIAAEVKALLKDLWATVFRLTDAVGGYDGYGYPPCCYPGYGYPAPKWDRKDTEPEGLELNIDEVLRIGKAMIASKPDQIARLIEGLGGIEKSELEKKIKKEAEDQIKTAETLAKDSVAKFEEIEKKVKILEENFNSIEKLEERIAELRKVKSAAEEQHLVHELEKISKEELEKLVSESVRRVLGARR